mmetsp:Transcript_56793/g.179609  ORF Transcript_56793/g.179609 Transcript_56793/m.179609 type:complete len:226 (-) Transcript_56793:2086-2763(-)
MASRRAPASGSFSRSFFSPSELRPADSAAARKASRPAAPPAATRAVRSASRSRPCRKGASLARRLGALAAASTQRARSEGSEPAGLWTTATRTLSAPVAASCPRRRMACTTKRRPDSESTSATTHWVTGLTLSSVPGACRYRRPLGTGPAGPATGPATSTCSGPPAAPAGGITSGLKRGTAALFTRCVRTSSVLSVRRRRYTSCCSSWVDDCMNIITFCSRPSSW